jgi:sialidase-1
MDPRKIKPLQKRATAVHALYSDDHGATWKAGTAAEPGTNEVTMAERSDGTLYMNARSYHGLGCRAYAVSEDGAVHWGPVRHDRVLIEPICQAGLLASFDASGNSVFLFSNPAAVRRERMTVRMSRDEGRTWPRSMVLYEGSAAYSDLVDIDDGWYGCLYERDGYDHLTFASFRLSSFEETK